MNPDPDTAFKVNPDPDMGPGFRWNKAEEKNTGTDLIKNCKILVSKLQAKPSVRKSENAALQKNEID